MWCRLSLPPAGAPSTLPFDPVKDLEINVRRRLGCHGIKQLAGRFRRGDNVPSNDFGKRIAGSPLELAQELIGVIVDRDGFTHTRTLHECAVRVKGRLSCLLGKCSHLEMPQQWKTKGKGPNFSFLSFSAIRRRGVQG